MGMRPFGIYLAHMFFIPLWISIFDQISLTSPLVKLPGIFVLTIAASVMLERVLRKFLPTPAAMLFGESRKASSAPAKIIKPLLNDFKVSEENP